MSNRYEKIPAPHYLCTADSYMKGGHISMVFTVHEICNT